VTSHRLRWSDLPRTVRADVEALLGASVVSTRSGVGGYSPSFASRCDLADGRRVFVKAVSSEQNPDSPEMLRREMEVTRRLPESVPAPRLLHSMDDGNWVVGVFDYVEGRLPRVPWVTDELDLVIDLVALLGSIEITPAIAELETAQARLASMFGRWKVMAADPPRALDRWARAHLDELVRLEADWPDAVAGDVFVHLDVRSDNVLLTATGAVLVDWPHACIGAPGLDLLVMLPSVALEGGGDPEEVRTRSSVLQIWDRRVVDAVVAALAGFFLHQSQLPDPPGLPTVRAFQRAQGEVTLRWLRTRLGDPESQ
jgi:aminoglycoside phosphotransferase (APT) family kinase protein